MTLVELRTICRNVDDSLFLAVSKKNEMISVIRGEKELDYIARELTVTKYSVDVEIDSLSEEHLHAIYATMKYLRENS